MMNSQIIAIELEFIDKRKGLRKRDERMICLMTISGCIHLT